MALSPFSIANLHADQRVRYIDEDLEILSPMAVPFLNLVGINGEAVDNPKIEWEEDLLLAESISLAGSGLADEVGPSTMTVDAGVEVNLQIGNVCRVENELIYVEAHPTATTYTVVRQVGGTTKAAHAAGVTVEILSVAIDDRADSPEGHVKDLSVPYNVIQAFDVSFKISFVQEKTRIHGIPEGSLSNILAKKTKEMFIKLERQAIEGRRQETSGTFGATGFLPNMFGGLDFFLGSYTSSPATHDPYLLDLSGAQLTEKHINDALAAMAAKVGQDNMADTMLVNSWNARRISDIYSANKRAERAETTGGVVINRIDTLWGPIDVVNMTRVPQSKVYFVRKEYLSIHPYEGLAFAEYELPTNGAQHKRQLYGVYTMKVKNTKAQGKLYGTATA